MKTLRVGPYCLSGIEADSVKAEDGDAADGQLDIDAETITTDKALGERHRAVIRWHEVLHALDTERDLNLSEHVIVSLSHGVVQVLRDNPEMRCDA